MDKEHKEQACHIETKVHEEVKDLKTRFDRHLEIYANNGKAMQKLADAVALNTKTTQGLSEDVREVLVTWGHFKWGKKAIIGLLSFAALLFGVLLAGAKLLK